VTSAAAELENVDVAIVGGGPAGLALACALCQSCSVLHVVGHTTTTFQPPHRACVKTCALSLSKGATLKECGLGRRGAISIQIA